MKDCINFPSRRNLINYSARYDNRINFADKTVGSFHLHFLLNARILPKFHTVCIRRLLHRPLRYANKNSGNTKVTHLRNRVYPTMIAYDTPGFRENFRKENERIGIVMLKGDSISMMTMHSHVRFIKRKILRHATRLDRKLDAA